MSFVVVGVGGGIAAFKACTLIRALTKAGHTVQVIPTPASEHFIGRTTWEALSARPIHTGVFDAGGADHVEIARRADLVIIAPATADLIARIRTGQADDLLTTTVLASRAPLVIAPAMHTAMWENAATQDNVSALRDRGVDIIGPVDGDLSSGDHGAGRMVEPEELAAHVLQRLNSAQASAQDLAGRHVVVTAGGTHEAIDPVRYLANHSTGLQGIAIANEAARRGARVTLIGANIAANHLATLDHDVRVESVVSALDMEQAVYSLLAQTDALVMAAAVADFRPLNVSDSKIKKTDDGSSPAIVLTRNPDILAGVTHSPQRPAVVVGFAAETGTDAEILAYAQKKATRKQADLLVVNRVGQGHGFGAVPNTVDLLTASGEVIDHASGTKTDVAHTILHHVSRLLSSAQKVS